MTLNSGITQKAFHEKKFFWTFEALLALPDSPKSLTYILTDKQTDKLVGYINDYS
jgi:hypothetical protein